MAEDSIAHPDLRKQLAELELVHVSILAYKSRTARPPVLDSSVDALPASSQTLPGLRPFLESVMRDKEALAGFLADPHVAELPPLSTNAPYLISVWKEVLAASEAGPIVAVGKTFYDGKPGRVRQPKEQGARSAKNTGVKVDVVAEDGRSWIRVNTTKNSRLLAEFREIDSYDTGSESEDEHGRPSLAQTEFDNSLLIVGRALLAAARANPFPAQDGPQIPDVTLRLTRLDPETSVDMRIPQTIDLLRKMGLAVLLGDRLGDISSPSTTGASSTAELVPTTQVNLDLSILIAFISDLTHAALPATTEEAERRFVPSASYIEWKRSRLRAKRGQDGDDDVEAGADDDLIKHSRALADQQKQEMTRGLLHEVHRRLSVSSKSVDLSDVEFWTTKEARDRCLRIVAKIGGPDERRRVKALFSSSDISVEQARHDYWRESRYSVNYLPLLPIRIYPTASPEESSRPTSQFAAALEATCRDLLDQGPTESMKSALPAPTLQRVDGDVFRGDSGEMKGLCTALGDTSIAKKPNPANDEIGRASVTRANPKLTEHTVHSMLWGVARGLTTLTANRASVKALLREMRGRGLVTGSIDAVKGDSEKTNVEDAVIWTVDPRSLAEGMRSDFTGVQ